MSVLACSRFIYTDAKLALNGAWCMHVIFSGILPMFMYEQIIIISCSMPFKEYRHSHIDSSRPFLGQHSCHFYLTSTCTTNFKNDHYSSTRSSFNISSFALIAFWLLFLLAAYFWNRFFWSPSHTRTLVAPAPTLASIMTRTGYLSTQKGVTFAEGKMSRTDCMAVSRSCSPPSQLRDFFVGCDFWYLIFEVSTVRVLRIAVSY